MRHAPAIIATSAALGAVLASWVWLQATMRMASERAEIVGAALADVRAQAARVEAQTEVLAERVHGINRVARDLGIRAWAREAHAE